MIMPLYSEVSAAKNARTACLYAIKVLKDRFYAAESLLATDATYAVLYAEKVIQGLFVEAEPVIATDADCSLHYARHSVKGRWPKGELAMSQCALTSVGYARLLKGPFVLGEEAIFSSKVRTEEYVSILRAGEPTPENRISLFRTTAVLKFVYRAPSWTLDDPQMKKMQEHWKQTIDALGLEPCSMAARECAKAMLFPEPAVEMSSKKIDFSAQM